MPKMGAAFSCCIFSFPHGDAFVTPLTRLRCTRRITTLSMSQLGFIKTGVGLNCREGSLNLFYRRKPKEQHHLFSAQKRQILLCINEKIKLFSLFAKFVLRTFPCQIILINEKDF